MSRKIMTVLGLVLAFSMILAACAPAKTPTQVAATNEPVATEVPVVPGPTYADTIIIGTWQQPRTWYDPAITQAISVEIELMFRPRFVIRSNYGYQANPALVEGDYPTLENGGAVLNDVTVAVGEPYFDTTTYMVQAATEVQNVKQLVVTGHLKAGLMWDDGEPLTANDLVFAWQMNCDPAAQEPVDLVSCPYDTANPGRTSGILSNYEATDDTTVVATYVPGAVDATYMLTPFGPYGILPAHLFTGMTVTEIEVDPRATGIEEGINPLGYGPYKMVAWAKGDTMTFDVNPYWSGAPAQTAHIIYKFYADSTSMAAAVIAGEIDATGGTTGLSVDQAPYMESVASRGLIDYSVDLNSASFEMMYINYYDPTDKTFTTPDPVLSEFCVRKAISLALDRQKMVDTIYYGDSSVVQQPQLPQMVSYNESVGVLTYDPALANTTLDACGWVLGADGIREKNGVRAATNYLTTSGNAVRLKASQIIQSSLKAIGIEVKLTYVPSSVAFSEDGLYGRNFNMMQFANVFSVIDPGSWFFGVANCGQIPLPSNAYAGGNYAGWCDPAASDAAAHAAFLTLDPAERLADWNTVLAAYFAEGDPTNFATGGIPVIPLYTRPTYLAVSPNLSGNVLDSTEYNTWNIETWTLAIP